MAYVDLNTIHNPDTGTVPPHTWGDQIRDNFVAGMPDIFTAVGDLAVGSGADAGTVFPIGTAGQYLRVAASGTALEYASLGTAAITLEQVYPVGSIYISVVSTNPNTLFGIGTWVAFGTGRVLVGIDPGDADFDSVEETSGAKTIAAGTSGSGGTGATGAGGTGATTTTDLVTGEPSALTAVGVGEGDTVASKAHTHYINVHYHLGPSHTHAGPSHTHSTPTHSIVQPSIAIYMWKRTA